MISRKVLLPTLLLSLVAGLGVSAEAAQTARTPKKKSTTSGTSGHRTGKRITKSSRRQRGQKAPTSDRISEIQTAMAKDGSYTGQPNGKWDDSAVVSLRRFQSSHGLNPTGRLD